MDGILRSQRIHEEGSLYSGGCDLIFRNIDFFVTDTAAQSEELRLLGWKRFLPFVKHRIYKPQKRILHELTGIFRANRSTAILGPSGAGKTSLLSIIVRKQYFKTSVFTSSQGW
jgi:ABC-type molybdenum transport system ATPase subunit/photorepair protein PhrA